jgi:PAS domain S-box-containing protein
MVGRHGLIGERVRLPVAEGEWARAVDSVNELIELLSEPAVDVSRVLGAVAEGDLTQRMPLERGGRRLSGEYQHWAETVNTMVDQLNAFASEVTRVAREVGTEGKLGGQADVRGVGGTWKDLTDSVNLLAANLTTQVRAIGEVATAVTRGDLGRTVEVDAQGEVRILKDDINEMIRRLRDSTRENTEQVWLKANLARFGGLLQGERDPEKVARLLLSELAPLLGVMTAVFYVRQGDNESAHLRLIGTYARTGKSDPPAIVQLGDGLLGQCAVEGRRIVVTGVPSDYVEITSALGRATPNMIVLLPVRFEHETLAVIELAAFDAFTQVQLDFLDQLSESIAIVLNTIIANERTAALAQEQAGRAEAEAGLARLRQVVDVMPEGIVIADGNGSVYLHNAAAADIMGMVPRSVAEGGQPVVRRLDGSICPPEDQPLARAVFRQEGVRGEQLLVTNAATGREVPILVNSAPLSDPSRAPAGGVAVFQDIGPLHDLDRQRDQFLAAVSHDLRTPVAVIKGRTDLLQRAVKLSKDPEIGKVASGLRTIDESTARLGRLIDELLDLTKLRMGHPVDLQLEPTDLVEVTSRIAAEYAALTPDHRIRFTTKLEGLVGKWDAARIERVLANLLSNAVKYSTPGADIAVEAWREASDGHDWAVLAVRNGGVGIPPDEIGRIFDTYYRATNVAASITGTGVGLAGVRHIVEQHGGLINVESTPGETTTFTVRLPLRSPPGAELRGGA